MTDRSHHDISGHEPTVSGFSFIDPLEFIRKKRTQQKERKSWTTTTDHYIWRNLTASRVSGEIYSSRRTDDGWKCYQVCRSIKITQTAKQIMADFAGRSMYLEVIDKTNNEAARKRAQRIQVDYYRIPVGSHTALLLDGPLTENSEVVDDRREVVRSILELKENGNVSRTKGFRDTENDGEAETKADAETERIASTQYWEGYHLGTSRRCGHLHDEKQHAQECAHTTGWRIDGSIHHWYARRTSGFSLLGSLGVSDTVQLLTILDNLKIGYEEWKGRITFDPISWDDQRFIEFRLQARWKRPPRAGEGWTPALYPVEVSISGIGALAAREVSGGR